MAEFFEFLGANELLIVVSLMIAIFVLIMAIIIIDAISRKDKKHINTNDGFFPLEKPTIYEPEVVPLDMIANKEIAEAITTNDIPKSLEKTAEIEEIKYVEENEELEKTKALIELQTLKEELAKLEDEDKNRKSVENINVVEEPIDLNAISIGQEVDLFEDSQEENAIISVEELTKKSARITDEEIMAYEDDGNEPISITELEKMYSPKPVLVEKKEMPDFDIKMDEPIDLIDKGFKSSPLISPVHGISDVNISLEQTADLERLNEEIRKTNEFLMTLKELRKKLE